MVRLHCKVCAEVEELKVSLNTEVRLSNGRQQDGNVQNMEKSEMPGGVQ
jgi:hypothetical protein